MSSAGPGEGISEAVSALGRTAGALSRLAESELELTGALLLRAALLACVTAACLAAAIAVAAAAAVTALAAAGLSWPLATLATFFTLLLIAAICIGHLRKALRESALPATRRQLHALLPTSEGRSS